VVDDGFRIHVEGVDIQAGIERLFTKMKDLRPIFELFSSDFYKDEKRIFQLPGPGQYEDLSEPYGTRKEQIFGERYPILFATGKLANSLLGRNKTGSINKITKRNMTIGTSIPYGAYHHLGTSKMPQRPLWFLDPENNTPLGRRWKDTLDAYGQVILTGSFKLQGRRQSFRGRR